MRIPRTNITVWPFLNILQTRANNGTGTVRLMLWGKQLGSLEVAISTRACSHVGELRVDEEKYHTMANLANRVGGGTLLVAPDRVRERGIDVDCSLLCTRLRKGTVCP
jgi:hypothetical protein